MIDGDVPTVPDEPAEPAARACGGMVAGQGACAEGEFCDFPREATCGAADAPGVCRTRPEMCTEQYAPVCGCDDQTYGNDCMAARAGVSVAAEGECPQRTAAAGEICGTRGALPCGEGLFCNFPTTANSLEVYVGYLRRKLEAEGEPRLIHTVRGVGYSLRELPS